MVRAQCVRPCRLAAPIGADLHWPPNGCTACARTLHAFCTGFSWVDSAHATESTHLIGTVVPCRRQPWTVHAAGRHSAISSGQKYDLYRPLVLVTGGSHVSHTILLNHSRPSKHFGARARIELWRGVRDRLSTVSTTVHQSLNDVARGKSGIMLQHGHRSRSLCNRIYYGAGTPIPANAQRLLGSASDLDGHMRTSRAQVPVKTAMKKEQMPSVRRDRRKTRSCAPFTRKMCSYWTP